MLAKKYVTCNHKLGHCYQCSFQISGSTAPSSWKEGSVVFSSSTTGKDIRTSYKRLSRKPEWEGNSCCFMFNFIKQLFEIGKIHPAVIKLGLQYASGIICGSNARAVALLEAFKRVISDYSTPEQKELSRDLEVSLKPCINFLKQCRPISVSMGNVIRFLKRHITNIPSESTDVQAKKCLHEEIEKYIHGTNKVWNFDKNTF